MADKGKHEAKTDKHAVKAEKPIKNYKKKSVGRTIVIVAVLFVMFLAAGAYAYYYMYVSKPEPEMWSEAFTASASKDAPVYIIRTDDNSDAAEVTETGWITRGTRVMRLEESEIVIDGVAYAVIDSTGLTLKEADGEGTETAKPEDADQPADAEKSAPDTDETAAETADTADTDETAVSGEEPSLYMSVENLSASSTDVVKETEVYVRTPATIYAEETGPAIASFAAKGSCLKVTGYDRLEDDGSVNKYRIEYGEGDKTAEGYVYSKYMVDTQERADAVFNDNGIYDKVKKDNYSYDLYGGKAKNLDYYPYERPVIKDNEFCSYARAMYLNCAAAAKPENYINIIKKTDCNAVVVDIKDGVLAYKSEVAKELSPTSYETAASSVDAYIKGIEELRATGVYLIGRIVVFNDPIYAKDHPENCIRYNGSSYWPSAYSRDVWEYNVRLALEAVNEFGFNEIQFDYVRFPDDSYTMSKSGKAKFRNKYDEEKGQAIQNFCFYAADQIHEAGAYFSVDVFGESAYGYMTAYGQYWPGISNIVDAISAMPYTDHISKDAWKDPYGSVRNWAKRAKKRQDYLDAPAAARTWITGYDTPYWAPQKTYGEKELKDQIKALEDAGLDGGFIPWNVNNDIGKYKQYKAIWNAGE